MADVRAKKTGTFDRSTKTWAVKGEGIRASLRKLSQMYVVVFDESLAVAERQSARYWTLYLQAEREKRQSARRASSPLQDRLKSVDRTISRFRAQNRSTGELERLRGEIIADTHGLDHGDVMILPPDLPPELQGVVDLAGIVEGDDHVVGLLHNHLDSLIPKSASPKPVMLRHESDAYLSRHKAKGHDGHYQVSQSLVLFLNVTGDIAIQDVSVDHWREFTNRVRATPSWGQTTKSNIQAVARQFLNRVEIDRSVTYSFLRNKDYMIRRGKGKKVMYSVDQMRLALQHATGDVRLALLLGMNCGQIIGDIITNTPDMIVDGHLIRSRKKNDRLDDPSHEPHVGAWKLWGETQSMLHFQVKPNIQDRYSQFKRRYGLPYHKALRKGVNQMIHEHDEPVARLYRNECDTGNHGRYYTSDMTPAQVGKLDANLDHVAVQLGIQ